MALYHRGRQAQAAIQYMTQSRARVVVVVVDAIPLHRPLAAGQVVVLRAATVAAQEQQIKALQAARAAAALTTAVVVVVVPVRLDWELPETQMAPMAALELLQA